MSTVTLHLGDCVEVMAGMADHSVDLTVTSPPYDNLRKYNGFTFDAEATARELWRVTKPGGVVVWVVADATTGGGETLTSFKQALCFQSLGFNCETMVYSPLGGGARGPSYLYWQAFEYMFVFYKGRPATVNRLKDRKNIKVGTSQFKSIGGRSVHKYGNRSAERRTIEEFGYRGNIWSYAAGNNGDDQTDHPAPFPEALARDHILSWSNPGDVVLDPMMGSGTTGKMAVKYQRNFIGCEIDPVYFKTAQRRIQDAQAQLVLPLFDTVAP